MCASGEDITMISAGLIGSDTMSNVEQLKERLRRFSWEDEGLLGKEGHTQAERDGHFMVI